MQTDKQFEIAEIAYVQSLGIPSRNLMVNNDGNRLYDASLVIDRWSMFAERPGLYRVALTIGSEAHDFLGIYSGSGKAFAVIDDFGSLMRVH